MLGFSSVNIIKLKWFWWLKVYRSIIKYVCCSFASLTRLIPWMQLLPLIRFSCWVLSVCWIISGFFNTSQRNWLRDRLLNVYHLISVDKWTERINLLFTFKPNSTDRMELNESTEWMNESGWKGKKSGRPTNFEISPHMPHLLLNTICLLFTTTTARYPESEHTIHMKWCWNVWPIGRFRCPCGQINTHIIRKQLKHHKISLNVDFPHWRIQFDFQWCFFVDYLIHCTVCVCVLCLFCTLTSASHAKDQVIIYQL